MLTSETRPEIPSANMVDYVNKILQICLWMNKQTDKRYRRVSLRLIQKPKFHACKMFIVYVNVYSFLDKHTVS